MKDVRIVQDFTAENVQAYVPASMVSEEGYLKTFPHKHGIDGAFAARMRRRGDTQ